MGNPCPVWDAIAQAVVLLATVSCAEDNAAAILSNAAHDTRRVCVSRSRTRRRWGDSRSEAAGLVVRDGAGGAVQLGSGEHAGRLVFPCNHAHTTVDGYVRRTAHVLLADTHGERLRLRVGGCAAAHSNEAAVAEASAPGMLLLNARDMSGRCERWAAESPDGGASWRDAERVRELIEPQMHGCHVALVRCAGASARLAFANPASVRREGLTIRWSDDDGRTWPRVLVMHAGPFAYCSLAALPPGGVGCPAGEGPLAVLFECGNNGGSPYARIDFAIAHSESRRAAAGPRTTAPCPVTAATARAHRPCASSKAATTTAAVRTSFTAPGDDCSLQCTRRLPATCPDSPN